MSLLRGIRLQHHSKVLTEFGNHCSTHGITEPLHLLHRTKQGHNLVLPKKLGIRLSPPALILIYEQASADDADASTKLRLRTIPLRNLETNVTSTDFLLEDLKSRHEHLSSVPDHKIVRMIEIIKKVRTGKGSLEEIVQENCRTVSEIPSKKNIKYITNEQNENNSSKNKVVEEKVDDEDTDFEIDDDLPLDKLESEEDDFWNL